LRADSFRRTTLPVQCHTGRNPYWQATEDFALALAEAQSIISQRLHKGWIWPLFEVFKDDITEPMRIVNLFIDPILKEAISKKSAEARGEKNVDTDDPYWTILSR